MDVAREAEAGPPYPVVAAVVGFAFSTAYLDVALPHQQCIGSQCFAVLRRSSGSAAGRGIFDTQDLQATRI